MPDILPDLLLWFFFALMTGGAIWALLRPLGRKGEAPADHREIALYRDQLAEVGRDLERGVIAPAEAEAARIEVSRRLLAAADAAQRAEAAPKQKGSSRRLVVAAVMVVVPALSLGLYLALGSPDLPDEPFEPRMSVPVDQLPLAALVLKVEQHLKEDPSDLRGWEVLAPSYIRQGRYAEAASAWGRAIALGGETAARFAAKGEAEAMAANGLVTPVARDDFARAEKLDPREPRAQFYLGIAEVEDGKKEAASRRWQTLLASAPKDAPWRSAVEGELAALNNAAPAPGPSAQAMGAAADMSPEARQKMIEGMVAGLAGRLEKNPDDIEGWLRLIRAYGVLGKHDQAARALATARKSFATDKVALSRLADAEKNLPAQ